MNQPIEVHKAKSDVIVINYPGYNGDINGWANKYMKLADFMVTNGIGAVVRTSNLAVSGLDFAEFSKTHLRRVIRYTLNSSSDICGKNNPEIYLVGYSAGAGVIASVAHEFPEVKKILLVAPSGDAGMESIRNGLAKFIGDVSITVGEKDEVVGVSVGRTFYDLATSASTIRLRKVPDCDHQFRGETNGMILSKAMLWAFKNDKTYPSPDGGIKLY